ncbi:MAG: thioredoxin [Trichodesmium sp. St16_bin4-tuft]|nr:thioredoxin [Trichodesmium sp. MAG_R01]MDE5070187.1 thioredoxin [Trichodesmium sp. St4_bin8_1]MDE5072113.1 thioredoxin [Trichodesmium sp. St5_bin8]MDE5078258.1 thioredoxin [Trichodesmium sp. St2_bin6]MDE5092506.1 thioredoxin [Trichodesmium sp. St18_bin3_1_1]MDE5098369.1 thioredoxin [Trichodesmium sp. St16_bin4-tuft]MDE5101725.1 thioredoxin [Trichodesmium sp. St19_bin2]
MEKSTEKEKKQPEPEYVPQVTDSSFKKDVLGSDIPVLVDFWAPWCGPCRMVAPVVEEIADQFKDKVKVVKINTDDNPNIASQYGIRSIPTLMIFKEGQKVDMVVGAVPKNTLANTLEKYLQTQEKQTST